jgi:hypothetical protein
VRFMRTKLATAQADWDRIDSTTDAGIFKLVGSRLWLPACSPRCRCANGRSISQLRITVDAFRQRVVYGEIFGRQGGAATTAQIHWRGPPESPVLSSVQPVQNSAAHRATPRATQLPSPRTPRQQQPLT